MRREGPRLLCQPLATRSVPPSPGGWKGGLRHVPAAPGASSALATPVRATVWTGAAPGCVLCGCSQVLRRHTFGPRSRLSQSESQGHWGGAAGAGPPALPSAGAALSLSRVPAASRSLRQQLQSRKGGDARIVLQMRNWGSGRSGDLPPDTQQSGRTPV